MTQSIQELGQLQNWAVQAAVDLQKRADATIKSLEADRARLQGTQTKLERNAVPGDPRCRSIAERGYRAADRRGIAAPLQEMKQAAGYLRQSLKEVSWLLIGLMISLV